MNRYGGQKLEELEIVEADDYIQVCMYIPERGVRPGRPMYDIIKALVFVGGIPVFFEMLYVHSNDSYPGKPPRHLYYNLMICILQYLNLKYIVFKYV